MRRRPFLRIAALLSLLALTMLARPAAAQVEQQKLINSAVATVERLKSDPSFDRLQPVFAQAKAVLIVPTMIKAGFIIGGEYGMGVLLVRRPDGSWSYPAFYTLGAGSLGLQAGIQDSEVLLAVMTDSALSAVLSNAVKLGADIGIAFMAVGGGWEAATTTNLGADVYAFSRATGLYGGGSLEGALIKCRNPWNAAYYGGAISAEQILLDGKVANPQAEALRQALAR